MTSLPSEHHSQSNLSIIQRVESRIMWQQPNNDILQPYSLSALGDLIQSFCINNMKLDKIYMCIYKYCSKAFTKPDTKYNPFLLKNMSFMIQYMNRKNLLCAAVLNRIIKKLLVLHKLPLNIWLKCE